MEFRPRNQCNANFFPSDRRYICLPVAAPVDFNIVAPRRHFKMLAQPDPLRAAAAGGKPCPIANAGVLSVSADDPPASDRSSIHQHGMVPYGGNASAPKHLHAARLRLLQQQLVQQYTPDTPPAPCGNSAATEVSGPTNLIP